ncbi:histidinol-phosphatase, partial [bacterium LRH843]|nr:histidinol-phosphatase [bacterium LRH843]
NYAVRVIKNRDPFGSFVTDAETRKVQFTDTPGLGERNYYRVEIEGPQAPYPEVPNSMAQSQNMIALSNPLYFNYNPDF